MQLQLSDIQYQTAAKDRALPIRTIHIQKHLTMEEKLVAHNPFIRYVTKESRTPQRASGTFLPPVEDSTRRRLPRLLRFHSEAKQTGIATPV